MNERSCCDVILQQTQRGIKSVALKEEHIVLLLFVYCSSLHYYQVCLIAWCRSEWACWQRSRLEADEFPGWIILQWLNTCLGTNKTTWLFEDQAVQTGFFWSKTQFERNWEKLCYDFLTKINYILGRFKRISIMRQSLIDVLFFPVPALFYLKSVLINCRIAPHLQPFNEILCITPFLLCMS